jgi:hypothetical protein
MEVMGWREVGVLTYYAQCNRILQHIIILFNINNFSSCVYGHPLSLIQDARWELFLLHGWVCNGTRKPRLRLAGSAALTALHPLSA